MTTGIGNPDWQRRYGFGAVPLATYVFTDGNTTATANIDTNGFTRLLLSVDTVSATAQNRLWVQWYVTQASNSNLQTQQFSPVPNAQSCFNVPVLTRYCNFTWQFISGAAANFDGLDVYGSLTDNVDTFTRQPDLPLITFSNTVGAGVTTTTTATNSYGGPASVHMSSDANNKWNGSLDYYDIVQKAWKHFHIAYGADRGQAWTQDVRLPYAPIRANITNTDTVANNLRVVVTAS